MKKLTAIILTAITLLCALSFDTFAAHSVCKLKAGESVGLGYEETDIAEVESSAPKIAEVRDNRILALTKGSAVITARLKDGETVEYPVKVTTNPKIVGVKKKVEKNCTFSIYVKGAASKVKYSSSKPKVASVTAEGDVTTKKVGTTTIKAKVNGITLSFKLEVYAGKIVNRYKATLKKGYTYALYYSEVGKTPKIVSDNPKIVKVTKKGKIYAKKRGTATLTFTHKKAKVIVKVKVV